MTPQELDLVLLALYYLVVAYWPYLLGGLVALMVVWMWRKK